MGISHPMSVPNMIRPFYSLLEVLLLSAEGGSELKRFVLRITVMLLGLIAVCQPIEAAYPDRPVKVIVHTPAGGGTDTLARLLFGYAGELAGVTFVVENHAGAGGQIGYTRLATSKPDGYTVGAMTTMSIVTHELTRPDVLYRLKDSFRPLARIVLDPSVLVVRADSPFKTLDDLIRAARGEPRKITWGGTFLWGAHHVHYELFRRATEAELVYIPFDGAADSRAALLGGHIDVGAGGFSEYASLVREGKLRVLVSGAAERWLAFPDVPTYRDLGYEIRVGSDRGFAVPAGTPPERVEFLTRAIQAALDSPGFLAAAEAASITPSLAPLFGTEYAAYLARLQVEVKPLLDSPDRDAGQRSVLASSKFFPATLLVVLLVLTGVGLARRFVHRWQSPWIPEPPEWKASLKLAALATTVIVFYLLLPLVGFAVSGMLLMAAGMLLLAGRQALRYLPVAVLVPLTLILVFRYGLGIRLPMLGWH